MPSGVGGEAEVQVEMPRLLHSWGCCGRDDLLAGLEARVTAFLQTRSAMVRGPRAGVPIGWQ